MPRFPAGAPAGRRHMTLPPGHHSPQRNEPDSITPPDKRLDQPSEDDGPWTVETVDGREASGTTRVVVPGHPPELHPAAAAALLTLLRHANPRRTDNSQQEH